MNQENLMVSIITPCYNSEKTLLETYESIRNQTYTNWEWIVVDDCSSDNSKKIISDIAKNDCRVVAVFSKKNGGAAICRNKAIELAKGRFIAFLDSDDCWKSEKLSSQIKFMLDNNISFCYSNYDVLYPSGRIYNFIPKKNRVTYRDLLKKCDIGCLTVVYDSKKIGKKFMPTDVPKREDYAAWLDITRDGLTCFKINENLAVYRVNKSGVSFNKLKLLKFTYNVYRKHEGFNAVKSLIYLLRHSFNKVLFKYW